MRFKSLSTGFYSIELGLNFCYLFAIKTAFMRQRFEQQLDMRIVPICDVKIPTKSRDELPPTLRALQYIFVTPSINEKIFELLEDKICKGKKKTGRPGMDLWHVLVLAVIRQSLDTNWDRLTHIANYDFMVRNILGVLLEPTEYEFEYQNILDNVSLVDEELLQKLNDIVLEAGMQLIKKKESEALCLKTDSYALETNIHFPTDLNLLWDSSRKILDTVTNLRQYAVIEGWRKIKSIRKTLKSQYRATAHQVFKGKNEAQKKQSLKDYLQQAIMLEKKADNILASTLIISDTKNEQSCALLLVALKQYNDYSKKFTNQIDRRLLKEEEILSSEKIYSIFEPHSEWITKGKANKRVELGHLLMITTNQYQYIVDYKILQGEKDATQIPSLIERITNKYKDEEIASHSFDKGYWSKENLHILQESKIKTPVLPKRGNYTKADKEREGNKAFKKLRNKHSAVESNINMLEHHGLNRCRDKGLKGFKRCVGLSILAYNLHIMGNCLQEKEKQKEAKLRKLVFKKVA
jgi:transposase, IS5 family